MARGACWLSCRCSDPCDLAEQVAESRAHGDEFSAVDREREADWWADRQEREIDERWTA